MKYTTKKELLTDIRSLLKVVVSGYLIGKAEAIKCRLRGKISRADNWKGYAEAAEVIARDLKTLIKKHS